MNAALETGQDISDITTKFTRIYNEDMLALGVLPPDVQPTATTHIAEMIALIEKLIERGHAYAVDGHVLFWVPSFAPYGGLSGRSRDDQIAGARVEVSTFKKDPADFVLWKPSTPDQVGWDSPWGYGRPGWHIECSAMAEKHLGLPFDIHGGGADLKFPHHENEIAQSCCAHGHNDLSAFAKNWVHNGFVTVEGEKMSKSLGNTLLAHDMIKDQPGEVLRLALLSAHYRQPLDWTAHGVEQARKYLDRLYKILADLKDVVAVECGVPDSVMDALCDDLNTPKAMAAINDLTRTETDPARLKGGLLAIGQLLGLLQANPQEWLGYGAGGDEAAEIDALVQERQDAKKSKDFARADEIRKTLEAQGVVIEDTPAGPKWKKA
jgi:cysteinyl-tRNA synthetase